MSETVTTKVISCRNKPCGWIITTGSHGLLWPTCKCPKCYGFEDMRKCQKTGANFKPVPEPIKKDGCIVTFLKRWFK